MGSRSHLGPAGFALAATVMFAGSALADDAAVTAETSLDLASVMGNEGPLHSASRAPLPTPRPGAVPTSETAEQTSNGVRIVGSRYFPQDPAVERR